MKFFDIHFLMVGKSQKSSIFFEGVIVFSLVSFQCIKIAARVTSLRIKPFQVSRFPISEISVTIASSI